MMVSELQGKFEALTSREKTFLLVTLLVISWSGWDSFVYRPLKNRQSEFDQKLVQLKAQLTSAEQSTAQLEKEVGIDPNGENLQKLSQLKAQYDDLQLQLMNGNKTFVAPELMAKALGDMLDKNHHLTLTKLETLAPTTLLKSDQQLHPIYKHGLVITFTGTYADTVDYLEALEALPWVMAWDQLDYRVKAYPIAEITLRTYTLSFEKRWLGV
jgi:MSHA biogenesis protein MshJ